MKIIADERIPKIEDYFSDCGELILKPGREISRDDVCHADALIVRTVTNVSAELLTGSQVKFVGTVTAGTDHLDLKWLQDAGVEYRSAAGFNAPAVADYLVSAVAALSHKHILIADKKKAAVIGVGHTGRLAVARLKLLGFDVVQCDPIRAENEPDFISTPLDEIEDVDLITLHVPLTDHGAYPTRHMVNTEFLRKQKSGCVLINASRGGVMHPEEIIKSGAHLNWCFDVWPNEPAINKATLMQTILATPHIAGYSVQSKMRGTQMIYAQFCEAFPGCQASRAKLTLPQNEISFAKDLLTWQDVVLGIYNPIITTAMMRATLLPEEEVGYYFDEMRHQFQYRHEFAYTSVKQANLSLADKSILSELGVRCD